MQCLSSEDAEYVSSVAPLIRRLHRAITASDIELRGIGANYQLLQIVGVAS